MFGKHFECMYVGSMFGAGPDVFAVWGWIISHAVRGRVEINPKLLAATLGTTEDRIIAAIEFLSKDDPKSRNKEYDGRRIVREGEYQYFLPSHEIYNKIANEEQRREYLRVKKREERSRNNVNRRQQTSTMSTHTDTDTEAYINCASILKKDSSSKEEKNSEVDKRGGFDVFWEAYPKKVGKAAARKAWDKAKINGKIYEVLDAIHTQKQGRQWQSEGGRFIPNPATWINQGRWEDGPEIPNSPAFEAGKRKNDAVDDLMNVAGQILEAKHES